MGRKTVRKALKIIIAGIGIATLLLIAYMIGMHVERNRQETVEMQKEHISTIAVVNMDDGIVMEEAQINYASQLMSFPGDNFTVTGLTDAKSGIENGSYAAYIVIPETFSASVTSIENEPRKVALGYQYNAKLDEESELQAVNDVNAFITLLNSNIAYMYMDAILAEFHRVQDDSSTILSNDKAELELLKNVNAIQLIAVAEPVEEIFVENNIKPVELTTYTTKNTVLLESLLLSYAEATQKGKEDYTSIQETNVEVETATDNFFSTYQAVIEDSASGQAELLETGRDTLADAVGSYNQDADAKNKEVEEIINDILDMQLDEDQRLINDKLGGILDAANDSNNLALNNLQKQWISAYKNLQNEVNGEVENKYRNDLDMLTQEVYIQGYNDALQNLNEKIDSLKDKDEPEKITVSVLRYAISENMLKEPLDAEVKDYISKKFGAIVENQLNNFFIDWDNLKVELPTVPENGTDNADDNTETGDKKDIETDEDTDINKPEDEEEEPLISLTKISDEQIADATNKILDLFKMQSDSEEINQIIQTYFVNALYEENRNQMSRLSDAEQQLSRSMEDYESSLDSYDPLQYIENAKLNTYLNDIETNAGEMLDNVEENNADYMLYATEMYTNTTEHTTLLRSSLDEANKQTVMNVENCVNNLMLSREEVNSENVSLLEGFTNSLRYTRVESQGNSEVYDYIVNPVVSQINAQTVTNTPVSTSEKENSVRIWLVIVLGIGIVICLIEVFINFRRQYKKPMEESEDLF